jgi:hypothetical protein
MPQVANMQAELQAMQPQLVQTVAEVEALMARIAHDKKVGGAATCAVQCSSCYALLSSAKTPKIDPQQWMHQLWQTDPDQYGPAVSRPAAVLALT